MADLVSVLPRPSAGNERFLVDSQAYERYACGEVDLARRLLEWDGWAEELPALWAER